MKREDIINELGNELKHQRGMQRKLTRLLADVSAEGSAIDDKALSHRTTGILVGDVLKALSAQATYCASLANAMTELEESAQPSLEDVLREAIAHRAAQSNPAGEQ
jgi:hypothetical protein